MSKQSEAENVSIPLTNSEREIIFAVRRLSKGLKEHSSSYSYKTYKERMCYAFNDLVTDVETLNTMLSMLKEYLKVELSEFIEKVRYGYEG